MIRILPRSEDRMQKRLFLESIIMTLVTLKISQLSSQKSNKSQKGHTICNR